MTLVLEELCEGLRLGLSVLIALGLDEARTQVQLPEEDLWS